MKNREEARKMFIDSGMSYNCIRGIDIYKLQGLIIGYLKKFENNGFTMKLCRLRKNDLSFDENGNLKKCFFRVKGTIKGSNNGVYKPIIHFKEREAVSFNQDGFIGFAGWADDKNVRPFVDAFVSFVEDFNFQ